MGWDGLGWVSIRKVQDGDGDVSNALTRVGESSV